jgi:hypothetical protein
MWLSTLYVFVAHEFMLKPGMCLNPRVVYATSYFTCLFDCPTGMLCLTGAKQNSSFLYPPPYNQSINSPFNSASKLFLKYTHFFPSLLPSGRSLSPLTRIV